MDGLYSEILYKIVNCVGFHSDSEQQVQLDYLQKVFNFDDSKHRCLLEGTKAREKLNICLNVEVIEAIIEKPTDINGLSDPFCILYLATNGDQQYKTTIKTETLNPIWEEKFVIPVKNPTQDVLCIELWDFDPEETLREKMSKIKEVKGVRGLKLFLREVANSSSFGEQNNELIGSALILLKTIPTQGQTLICNMDKNGKLKKQGDLKLNLSFQFENKKKSAFQEYRLLLYTSLIYHFETTQVDPYKWTGEFSNTAETLLIQYLNYCGLSPSFEVLGKWIAFINVHVLYPISFTILLDLLKKLTKSLEDHIFSNEEDLQFWDAVTKLLPSLLMGVKRTQILSLSNKTVDQSVTIFRLLSCLAELQPPEIIVLFPKSIYNWLGQMKKKEHCDVKTAVIGTVSRGAVEWFSQILEKNAIEDIYDENMKLKSLVTVIDTLTSSLRKAIEYHEVIFQECFQHSYSEILFKIYETEISNLVEPEVSHICKSMKPLIFNDKNEDGVHDNDPLAVGSALFEVYIRVRQFSELGKAICLEHLDLFLPNNYHCWFNGALIQWMYISKYKAMRGIHLSLQKDNLEPLYNGLEISSSADDALHLFEQINVFWKRLSWPDVTTCYALVTRIIDDICECLVLYADKMKKKVQEHCESLKEFQITKEWCTALRNISHIQHYVLKTTEQFEVKKTISAITEFRSSLSEDKCWQSVQTLIDNGIETSNCKILDIIDMAIEKMMIPIRRFLPEATDNSYNETNNVELLMRYLDDNLYLLHSELDSGSFNIIFNALWKKIITAIFEIVDSILKMRGDQLYFKELNEILQKMVNFFKQINADIDLNNLINLQKFMKLNEMTTRDLLHEFHLDLIVEQKITQESKYGLITIRAQFLEDILKIEILNARNLQPLCPSGFCAPYVKVCLLPPEKFIDVQQYRTKTHRRTTFPLFDEKFTIQLTSTQKNMENALLMLIVKDEHFLGTNKFLGEALLLFSDIPKFIPTTFENLEQIHLILSRTRSMKSDVYKILTFRQDRVAKDFIKSRETMYPQSM